MLTDTYLLDTNYIIALFKRHPDAVKWATLGNNVSLSSIVIGELFYGVEHSTQKEKHTIEVETLLGSLFVHTPNVEVAKIYGKLKNHLKNKGLMIPENDIWIAATAMNNKQILLSRDAHFERLVDLGLKLVQW